MSIWCLDLNNSKRRNEIDNPRKNVTQGLDNPWRNIAWGLHSSRWKIFTLELHNSNYELDTSRRKHDRVDSSCTLHGFKWSDSNIYTNFEFCEGENHEHFKNTLIYKAKKLTFIFFLKNSIHILEDNASCVKVGDIEQVLSKICFKYDKIT